MMQNQDFFCLCLKTRNPHKNYFFSNIQLFRKDTPAGSKKDLISLSTVSFHNQALRFFLCFLLTISIMSVSIPLIPLYNDTFLIFPHLTELTFILRKKYFNYIIKILI